MAKVLVTGGAGFIGSHTCDRLLAERHAVVAVDNFRTGQRRNLAGAMESPAFQLVECDVTDLARLDAVVSQARPDAIIHLAALVSVQESIADPGANRRLNVDATQHVIKVARRHAVGRVVFASSAAIYGDNPALPLVEDAPPRPLSPYGSAKLESEGLLLGAAAGAGFVARCLRYFNVFGPRQDPRSPYSGVISIFSDRMRQGTAPAIFGDGEQTRDFIAVGDVARANVIAATAPSLSTGVCNICTGRPTSLNQLSAALRKLIPAAPAPQHHAARAGDIRYSLGSPERARREMGFVAEIALTDGLAALGGGPEFRSI